MQIILGKTAGFCYGVNNAVTETYKYIENQKGKKVYCLGEIVHNRQVIEDLEKEKVVFVNSINELLNIINNSQDNITVIIRAHGEPKSTYEILNNKNVEILDFTCPNVSSIHKIVEDAIKDSYYIFLIGQKNHPEAIGTYGFCNGNCTIIENGDDIDNAINEQLRSNMNKILIVAQTTFSLEKFNQFIKQIEDKVEIINSEKSITNHVTIEIKNTICNATRLRQKETEQISKQVDYMVIIGGKNSSNTRKLYDISANNCKKAILIQNYLELENDFKEELEEIKKSKKVGIMAGASTPKESIDAVISLLK